jgi:hypothetical protein
MIDRRGKLLGFRFARTFRNGVVMPRSINSAKRQQWSERLQRFATSGQTIAAFCQSEAVSVPSFFQWRRKLAVTSDNDPNPMGSPRPAQHAFVPVRITSAAEVEVHLPNGVRIRLTGNDPALIGTVIAAAGRLPSGCAAEGNSRLKFRTNASLCGQVS